MEDEEDEGKSEVNTHDSNEKRVDVRKGKMNEFSGSLHVDCSALFSPVPGIIQLSNSWGFHGTKFGLNKPISGCNHACFPLSSSSSILSSSSTATKDERGRLDR